MSAGPDNQPLAAPGNFFPSRKRRVAELSTELFGRSFLPFPYLAAVDNYIMRVAHALDLDLAKFDQSCFNISIFRWPAQPTTMSAARRVISTFIVSVSQTYLFSPLSDLGSRRVKFHKRAQLFICANNETVSVAAMCVSNPDRSSL
jgi:hypothetical protein